MFLNITYLTGRVHRFDIPRGATYNELLLDPAVFVYAKANLSTKETPPAACARLYHPNADQGWSRGVESATL